MSSIGNAPRILAIVAVIGVGLSLLSACDDVDVSQTADSIESQRTAALESTSKLPAPPAAAQPTKEVEPLPPEPMPTYNVRFSVGSAQLSLDVMKTLTSAVDYLRTYPAVHVTLTGYTDLLGSSVSNKKLAEQRVTSVAQYLEESGTDPSRIVTVAVGEVDATHVPSGENPTTWNRRVEVEFSVSPSS